MNLKYIISLLLIGFIITSCSKDEGENNTNPALELNKIYTFDRDTHVIEVYSENQRIETGYNELYLRFLDKSNNVSRTDVNAQWEPVMQMGSMVHGAPHGNLYVENNLYKGFIVFQMAGDEHHFWELHLSYIIDGTTYELIEKIAVTNPLRDVKVQSFTGSDEVRYVLALKEPKAPKVAINNMEASLYKMDDMMNFSVVQDFSINIDPRMPSMGNHSSPNNEDLRYDSVSKTYKGKLSLTMTGFWRINMKLNNNYGDVIKGEDVTDSHQQSSLYFEIEF
ncbi:MAG TPA: hypothetical protein VFF21_01655 [Flavobacteriaceae bacterium]|nr:hypothetical protein [Flavobacteriaceae bacterium]